MSTLLIENRVWINLPVLQRSILSHKSGSHADSLWILILALKPLPISLYKVEERNLSYAAYHTKNKNHIYVKRVSVTRDNPELPVSFHFIFIWVKKLIKGLSKCFWNDKLLLKRQFEPKSKIHIFPFPCTAI